MENDRQAMENAMRIARSEAGQQLFKLLQQSDSRQLALAMQKASAGDYSGARDILQQLMQDPGAQKLLNGMGGNHGSAGR